MANTCVFCDEPLSSQTREQHFIQRSIGGTLSSKIVTCDNCNALFANEMDSVVAAKYAHVVNALAPALKIKGPNIEGEQQGTGQKLILQPGFKPKPMVEVKFLSDKKVSIRAGTIEKALKLLKSTGREMTETGSISYQSIYHDDKIVREAVVLHELELKSAVKTAIEYLCFAAAGMGGQFDIVRAINYAKSSDVDVECRPSIIRAHPTAELRNVGFPISQFAHRIWISCGPNGINAILDLFSAVSYRMYLGKYVGAPLTLLYQKNILASSKTDFSDILDRETPMPNKTPWSKDLYELEGDRIRKLIVDAHWFVDTTCKDAIVSEYRDSLRDGIKIGEKMNPTSLQVADLVERRLRGAFSNCLADFEVGEQAERILADLRKEAWTSVNEDPEVLSAELADRIWKLHFLGHKLFRDYIGVPDYGQVHFGVTVLINETTGKPGESLSN